MEEQAVIDKIEDVAEAVVPEVFEQVEKFRNNPAVVIGVGVVGLAVGSVIGYFVARKRLTAVFEAQLEAEIDEAKHYYESKAQRLTKDGDYSSVEAAAEALGLEKVTEDANKAITNYGAFHKQPVTIVETEQGLEVTTVEQVAGTEDLEETTITHHNIFVDGKPIDKDEWDQDVENSKRNERFPFVISVEEFNENEPDHEQMQVTYYAGDDVLADDSDGVISAIDSNVGQMNLNQFGHGSGDPKIVYIRNNRRQVDYEVALHEGKYAKVVLDIDDDEEDEKEPLRKFRGGDD